MQGCDRTSKAAREKECSRGPLRPLSRVHHTCSGTARCQHCPGRDTASWGGACPGSTGQCMRCRPVTHRLATHRYAALHFRDLEGHVGSCEVL